MRNPELDCPGCHGRRTPAQPICNRCWRALPNITRGRLARRDFRTGIRLQHLHRELKAGTPLGVIRVPR